jgi:hypothetical protein
VKLANDFGQHVAEYHQNLRLNARREERPAERHLVLAALGLRLVAQAASRKPASRMVLGGSLAVVIEAAQIRMAPAVTLLTARAVAPPV